MTVCLEAQRVIGAGGRGGTGRRGEEREIQKKVKILNEQRTNSNNKRKRRRTEKNTELRWLEASEENHGARGLVFKERDLKKRHIKKAT